MELTNCLWGLATLEARGKEEEAAVLALTGQCKLHLESFGPRNLALSAWALAKLGYTDPSWCQAWAGQVLASLPEFDTRDMTMVIWSFATIHWRNEAFLSQFCREVVAKCADTSPQDIGNTLWALATLSYRDEAALAALCAQSFEKAQDFDQQNLSISLWSLATLGYKNMNLLHHLTQLVTERIASFASQGIANTVWACAKFQFQQKCLLMTVAEAVLPRLDDFEPQHLAILAWAYATLEFPNRPLLTAICRAASRKMHELGPQHMANTTWAMATLAHKDTTFLGLLVRRALEEVAGFNPQECSNLAWALALLTYRDDALLAALSSRSQEIVADFIPQNLGNTAWAYNRMGFRDEGLMRTLVRQAALRLRECQGQEVLDLIESVTTGGYEAAVDTQDWETLLAWSSHKYELAQAFLDAEASLPLRLPALSHFDKALAVQDYRDHLASFDLIGLGFQYTSRLLGHLGVLLPAGAELEEWSSVAQLAAVEARHETDMEKNAEAQEGLKACRTVCVYSFSLCEATRGSQQSVQQAPTPITSGPPTDAHELGIFAASLRHNRAGDGEFRALQACARACLEICPVQSTGSSIVGDMWLYVTEVPCLSCVSAMAQFRHLFPHVRLHVAFTLGRQPASGSGPGPGGLGPGGLGPASQQSCPSTIPAPRPATATVTATAPVNVNGRGAALPGARGKPLQSETLRPSPGRLSGLEEAEPSECGGAWADGNNQLAPPLSRSPHHFGISSQQSFY